MDDDLHWLIPVGGVAIIGLFLVWAFWPQAVAAYSVCIFALPFLLAGIFTVAIRLIDLFQRPTGTGADSIARRRNSSGGNRRT